jgi:Kef-type K+ transport system membrane component KefB
VLTALALVFVGAGAGYLIGQRVRVVPPPVAALLLGTLLGAGGPFGANLLWSEPQPLPPEPLATFRVLGAILLMWGAGVEMEVSLLRRRRHLFDAAAIGLSGALLSALATLGLLGSGLLGQFPAREQFGLVLLSAASAIPVLLAIVQSLGRTHHPLTATALTAALIVDLLLIALLPLATAEATPERALLPFARTLAYLLAMLLLAQGPWNGFVRQLGRRFWASSSRASPILVIGLGLIVGVTAAVELWGVDPLPAALGWGIGSKPFSSSRPPTSSWQARWSTCG